MCTPFLTHAGKHTHTHTKHTANGYGNYPVTEFSGIITKRHVGEITPQQVWPPTFDKIPPRTHLSQKEPIHRRRAFLLCAHMQLYAKYTFPYNIYIALYPRNVQFMLCYCPPAVLPPMATIQQPGLPTEKGALFNLPRLCPPPPLFCVCYVTRIFERGFPFLLGEFG